VFFETTHRIPRWRINATQDCAAHSNTLEGAAMTKKNDGPKSNAVRRTKGKRGNGAQKIKQKKK
jgi:hypothetical protein